jgi:phage gp29-like protein
MTDMVAFPISRITLAKKPTEPVKESAPVSAAPTIEFERRARMSGISQPQYLGTTLDVNRIQAALRTAERGDTWLLFTIFRDMCAGFPHLTAEWAKRRGVIVGQPESLVPSTVGDADDELACEVIREMIDGCRNWFDALNHFLDATLYPLSASEKIYEPVSMADSILFKHPIRYKLKEIAPIDYTLLCFKIPYLSSAAKTGNPWLQYDADDWESWLRFYETQPNGGINFGTMAVYGPNRDHHIVHRGNMSSPSIPPNFGGILRQILFLWLLSTQDRDWWALMMQKYGSPFIKAGVDAQQKDTVAFMQQAFSMAAQIGGLVHDKKALVELVQANATDGSNAHKVFSDFWNCEVSKLVVGQVLSSTPKNTGLGSGMAAQAEEVREDIRQFDTMKLGDTLKNQLFIPYLRLNGYRGSCSIKWGGMREGAASTFADTLQKMGSGGYELDDTGLTVASNKLGYAIRRRELPDPANAGLNGKPDNKPSKKE